MDLVGQSQTDCAIPAQGCEERATLGHRPPNILNRNATLRLAAALVLLALLAPLRWSSTLLAAEQPVVDPNALPKFPPVAAQDALNTFQLRKGFRLELVAAEPLVTDPIALAFDEDGRLFAVEMNDYPERGDYRQVAGGGLAGRG